MIIKLVNALLIVAVLVSASVLYSHEQAKRGVAREIATTEAKIREEEENIKLLTAEWSNLTRPDRIQRLAALHLKLQPISADQITTIDGLLQRVPAQPYSKLEPEGEDAIGDVLQKMAE